MRNAVIAIAGLFGLLLPACGGDGNESPPPAPGAEPKGTDRISISEMRTIPLLTCRASNLNTP